MFRASFIALSLAILAGTASGQELVHAIFVRVNGQPITQEMVVQVVKFLVKHEYKGIMPEDEEEQQNVQDAALRDIIRAYLVHNEASKLGIKPSIEASKRAIKASGLKPEEITPTIRKLLESDDLFEDIMSKEGMPILSPPPRQMKDFYIKNKEEFRTDSFVIVRTIFIPADMSKPQSYFKDRAETLQKTLSEVPLDQRTAAFAKAARDNSQDVFAEFGGLLTADAPEHWMPQEFNNVNGRGEPIFPEIMVQGIRALSRKGEIRLVVSKDGMHLLYLEDLRGGKVVPWEEASRMIEFVLRQRSKNEKMRAWLDRVFGRSDVKWHDGTAYDKAKLTEILLPSEKRAMKGM